MDEDIVNGLTDKIATQGESLMRGNLANIIADLEMLAKESSTAEISFNLKITVEKRNGKYFHGGKIAWNKTQKHSDETEMEEFDPQQMKLFAKEDAK